MSWGFSFGQSWGEAFGDGQAPLPVIDIDDAGQVRGRKLRVQQHAELRGMLERAFEPAVAAPLVAITKQEIQHQVAERHPPSEVVANDFRMTELTEEEALVLTV